MYKEFRHFDRMILGRHVVMSDKGGFCRIDSIQGGWSHEANANWRKNGDLETWGLPLNIADVRFVHIGRFDIKIKLAHSEHWFSDNQFFIELTAPKEIITAKLVLGLELTQDEILNLNRS